MLSVEDSIANRLCSAFATERLNQNEWLQQPAGRWEEIIAAQINESNSKKEEQNA